MRTTLMLEDELAERLRRLALDSGRSFQEVVNSVIRKGLSLDEAPPAGLAPFRVEPKACGFRAGVGTASLNQIYDEMELGRPIA